MIGCLLAIAAATSLTGCSTLNGNMSRVLPQADTAKIKKEVANDPFPSAAEAGVAFVTDG
jgi:hypothetical protein